MPMHSLAPTRPNTRRGTGMMQTTPLGRRSEQNHHRSHKARNGTLRLDDADHGLDPISEKVMNVIAALARPGTSRPRQPSDRRPDKDIAGRTTR